MQRLKRKVRNGDGTRPSFTCTQDGCGKSFSRSEHLHRHQKNHTDGDATCPRCRAHFKRQDLLERHMNRHRQKDDEAGGQGIGTLNTRKRMWKDHDGQIVQKRPTEYTSLECVGGQGASFVPRAEGPISPPVSLHHSDLSDPTQTTYPDNRTVLSEYSLSTGHFDPQDPSAYWIPPQPRGVGSSYLDSIYDEVFQPDTASSFNMPYTTQVNYDWLFSLNDSFTNPVGPQTPYDPTASLASYSCGVQQPASMGMDHAQVHPPAEARQYDSSATESPLASMASLDYMHSRGSAQNTTSPSVSEGAALNLSPAAKKDSPEGFRDIEAQFERPLATLQPPNQLPSIDEFSYNQILETIKASRPLAPNNSHLDINHPLLSHSSIQSYCDLYFTRFNTAYPLIHQATFVPSQRETLLLLSIILLGATYSEKEAHQLAVCIHDVIRPTIFSHASFNPKPDLWMLQTILLVECFGKSRAGQKQHDMSHLFHGMLINLIRRSDCQSVRPARPTEDSGDESGDDRSWRQWAEAEEKKRLALLCFMWDTQHAVLFCQSLCMSAFELRVPLPCNQTLWEASTAAEWLLLSLSTIPEPMYLLALKSYITCDTRREPHLNGLSRIIIFHGLMSIFWDMRRRNQTSLGVISSQSGRWQSRLGSAYRAWKDDFDDFYLRQSDLTFAEITRGSVQENAKVELDVWRTAYVTVYHAAHVLLHSEFLDIQIFAGARHILGRSVQRTDFIRSEKVVKRWATNHVVENSDGTDGSADAPFAAWHAAHLLQTASQTLVDFDSMGLFHVPWCLYLATLTIWTFHHTGTKGLGSIPEDDSELVWDAQAEMRTVVDSMVKAGVEGLPEVQGLRRTGGLVWVMTEVLGKVRWGIVHAGVTVLKGLIPLRLIGQFDGATV
ncbi:fungal-specific transcription factor domain-containing protein [Hypoxylon sp. NC1633]|nr:fungal-specific transcription factor domain-containing protein [Hypoxylon sp. NC1633]